MDYVGVVDCNNFFVSCERLFRPDLWQRPVVVLSSNDGCIVARSNEVKALGIPMGVPYFKVKEELQAAGATVFSSNFTLYRDISQRVMRVLERELGRVEQYSVDEAFFSIVGSADVVWQRIKDTKRIVEKEIGIPISIGVAKTKTIAKYAVEKNKKTSGLCLLEGSEWRLEAATLPLREIWGIGAKTNAKLDRHGLRTVADLLAADPARVDRLFGIDGLRRRDELSERPAYPVGGRAEGQKSIMSTRSFKAATANRRSVEDAVAYHVAQAAAELRELGQRAGYIQVLARPSRHGAWMLQGGAAERWLLEPTADTRVLLRAALELLATFFAPNVPYKKAGVVLGGFVDSSIRQTSLFQPVTGDDEPELMAVIDQLNERFGAATISVGRAPGRSSWQASREYISPAYTTSWTEIASVRA